MERTNLKCNKTSAIPPSIAVRKCLHFSAKKREITSLGTSPPRQACLLRAGAHWDGLLDVMEARTSPLHHSESHRLATPFSRILRDNSVLVVSIIFRQKHTFFAEKSGLFHNLPPETQRFFNLQINVVRHFRGLLEPQRHQISV